MNFVQPTVSDFKAYFFRDFPYGSTMDTVQDQDISKAYTQASFNFNTTLFEDQASYTMAYLYLSAHYLVMDLRMASQGVAGQFSWLENSKSAGSVSVGIAIPPRFTDNPLWSYYSKTSYGAKYMSLILPVLTAAIYTVHGHTKP